MKKKSEPAALNLNRYMRGHAKRFRFLFDFITTRFENKDLKILDIGKGPLTLTLNEYYNTVTSLGFAEANDQGGHKVDTTETIPHIAFDLNLSRKIEKWPNTKFDLIIFSEVIEHLYQAPEYTLLMFHSLLNENGHLICTTPNAAAIFRRYKLLMGIQPFAKIRYFSENPGHYREYTKKELMQMGEESGYKPVYHNFVSFNSQITNIKSAIVEFITNLISSFRWSQIIIYKKK
jgi:2-polyprenyl-3-methyl-5-hydroxy-6-metoxy-1,4-benzoquinol methylase